MSDRSEPPTGSQFLDTYEEGARVYYHRSGIPSLGHDGGGKAIMLTCGVILQASGALRRSESPKVAGNDML